MQVRNKNNQNYMQKLIKFTNEKSLSAKHKFIESFIAELASEAGNEELIEIFKKIIDKSDNELHAQLIANNASFTSNKLNMQIYRELLVCCLITDYFENTTSAVNNAYKLAIIFGNGKSAVNYLNEYWKNKHSASSTPIHDACLFSLPENDEWDEKHWQPIFNKYMIVDEFRTSLVLSYANRIELSDDEKLLVKNNQLPSRHNNKTFYKSLINKTLGFKYKLADQDIEAAALFYRYNLPEKDFETYLSIKPRITNSDDYIPPVHVNGADYGIPNMHVMKLNHDDPKAAILGHITNCCQSLNHEGHSCVEYGMTSKYSGFYIIYRSKKSYVNSKDIDPKDIIAQCWAWKPESDNLVFDSLECHANANQSSISRLTVALAKMIFESIGSTYSFEKCKNFYSDGVINNEIRTVVIGKGKTPKRLKLVESSWGGILVPYQYEENGYRDSKWVYQIYGYNNKKICYQMMLDIKQGHKAYVKYLDKLGTDKSKYQEYLEKDMKEFIIAWLDPRGETLSDDDLQVLSVTRESINSIDENQKTLLHYAVEVENERLVELLMKEMSKEAICSRNKSNLTILGSSIERKNIATFNFLIANVDINLFCENITEYRDVLTFALLNLEKEVFNQLLSKVPKREDIQFAELYKEIIWELFIKGSLNHVEYILELTGNSVLHTLYMNDKYYFHIILRCSSNEICKSILMKANDDLINILDEEGNSTLYYTLLYAKQDYSFVELIMNKTNQEIINLKNKNGNTILHTLFSGDGMFGYHVISIVELIMNKTNQEIINVKNNDGNTILHNLLSYNKLFGRPIKIDPRVLEYLINKVSTDTLDAFNNKGKTIFHYALKRNDIGLIKILASKMSNLIINQANYSGKNAFHLAVESNDVDAVNYLASIMSKEAIHQKTAEGLTAFNLIVKDKNINMPMISALHKIFYSSDNPAPFMFYARRAAENAQIANDKARFNRT